MIFDWMGVLTTTEIADAVGGLGNFGVSGLESV
jgi:hypothetical protein